MNLNSDIRNTFYEVGYPVTEYLSSLLGFNNTQIIELVRVGGEAGDAGLHLLTEPDHADFPLKFTQGLCVSIQKGSVLWLAEDPVQVLGTTVGLRVLQQVSVIVVGQSKVNIGAQCLKSSMRKSA